MNRTMIDDIMFMLLKGDDLVLENLRMQYTEAEMRFERSSDVGFFVDFKINNKMLKLDTIIQTFQIGDVYGTVTGIRWAVGFVLFIKDGYISVLEGYTNAIKKWPKNDEEIKLSYEAGDKRDMDLIKQLYE